jgi:hypothetical protein
MKRLVACALLLAGCGTKDIGAPCTRHSDCNSNQCGSDGTCVEMVEEPPDATTPDASTTIPQPDADTVPDAEGL